MTKYVDCESSLLQLLFRRVIVIIMVVKEGVGVSISPYWEEIGDRWLGQTSTAQDFNPGDLCLCENKS